MFQRKEWDHNLCPLCGAVEETTVHMMKCPHRGARDTWKIAIERLDEHMSSQHTAPDLQRAIISHLQSWQTDTPCPTSTQNNRGLRIAMMDQDRIGWYNFQLGRVARTMTDYQHDYYRRHGYKRTGFRWTVALINKLMATAWDMWEHRNSVLHGISEDYHTRRETNKADNDIKKEFRKGSDKVLRRHKRLFRSRRQTLNLHLTDKLRWLDSVTGARRAWKTYQDSHNYEGERRGIRNWQQTGSCTQPGTEMTWQRNNNSNSNNNSNNNKNRDNRPRTPNHR